LGIVVIASRTDEHVDTRSSRDGNFLASNAKIDPANPPTKTETSSAATEYTRIFDAFSRPLRASRREISNAHRSLTRVSHPLTTPSAPPDTNDTP
jgi:hypothetical protein